ncbi:MAG: hypothetical protein ACOVNU_02375 [Candidatus Kapaibacteriota bacterium]
MEKNVRIEFIENYIENNMIITTENREKLSEMYKELYSIYCLNNDLESVKRSLFLQWYAIAEPQDFTGIPDFDADLQNLNLKRIYEIVKNELFDSELIMMLKHYMEIAEWYFTDIQLLDIKLKKVKYTAPLSKFKMRGVMGRYWDSLNEL